MEIEEWEADELREIPKREIEEFDAEVEGDSIEEISVEINNALSESDSPKFMLMEPMVLTVYNGRGFSKVPSVGGEEFKAVGCYVGKTGKLIYKFKPVDAASYQHMELPEHAANRSFGREFAKFINDVAGHDFKKRKADAAREAALKAEQEKLKDRQEKYADIGFGSW